MSTKTKAAPKSRTSSQQASRKNKTDPVQEKAKGRSRGESPSATKPSERSPRQENL